MEINVGGRLDDAWVVYLLGRGLIRELGWGIGVGDSEFS